MEPSVFQVDGVIRNWSGEDAYIAFGPNPASAKFYQYKVPNGFVLAIPPESLGQQWTWFTKNRGEGVGHIQGEAPTPKVIPTLWDRLTKDDV